jgi:hypothetical protein
LDGSPVSARVIEGVHACCVITAVLLRVGMVLVMAVPKDVVVIACAIDIP